MSKPTILPSGFKPFRNQQISDQESPFFKIPGNFQEKTRIQGGKQDFFQPDEERFRPHDLEAVGLGESSTQEPEIAVDTSNRIRSPDNRNITTTQNEDSVFTHESHIKNNEMWLQMSQFSENTQENLANLQEKNEWSNKLTNSQQTTILDSSRGIC
ncbi:hypothetical protein O181_011549 [Austropuccinia psidii MF-1]|uniref:Uncharacterized protein n=1 Tax=Austropuccinia psidii MF-1 TaxID=1389203 RepID=A0A9Q3GLZ0_9BASI|nr:hypothetical protein [Austropuccinia psidii MF-1]